MFKIYTQHISGTTGYLRTLRGDIRVFTDRATAERIANDLNSNPYWIATVVENK